ncbi:MAG: S49 family peptidase, partial [Myxococcales bacterium]|nr:S49 family peptidase [Myxococcales bacterium]
TITGSIGVIMQLTNVEDAMGKVGVRAVTIRAGTHKDVGSATRPLTPRDRAYLQSVADAMYHRFLTDVAVGRRLPLNRVRALAEGRIYTGDEARQLGLVDRLGTLEDVIEETAKLMGVDGEPKVLRLERRSRWRRLFGVLAGTLGDALREGALREAVEPSIPPYAYLAPGPWSAHATGAFSLGAPSE